MKRLLTLVLFPLLAIALSPVLAQQLEPKLLDALQRGGYVLLIRHTSTDLIKEPSPMDLANCADQNRLNDQGRDEARALSAAFKTHKIPVGKILSSGYCRTMETARLAFGRSLPSEILLHPVYKPVSGAPVPLPYTARIEMLKQLLVTAPDAGANTVLVTHGENIKDSTGVQVDKGETIIFRPDGRGGSNMAGRVLITGWATK